MTHGVKNFYWRDGRPRWIIGKGLRDRGFKGRDLKDKSGSWLPLEAALKMAAALNMEAGVTDYRPAPVTVAPSPAKRRGFVYFLLVDDEHMKIGFAKQPDRRLAQLRVGIPGEINLFAAVPGTQADEQSLHALLARHRTQGEWFRATSPVMNCMLRCVKLRRVTTGQTVLNLHETS